MAQMPETIRVGYRDFRIEDWPSNQATAADRYGECDRFNGVIRIRTDVSPHKAAEVLLHEVLHAVYDIGCISGDDEEKIVSILGNQLAQVWRDNPQFVAFMESTFRS